jgi:hypothetical protein
MQLGKKVGAIRSTGKYVDEKPNRRKQLDQLGFVWRARATANSAVDNAVVPFEQIIEALVVYRNEVKPTGALSVPTDFTVPDSSPWPDRTRGLPLGRSIAKLRSKSFLKDNPDAAQKLQEIGFLTDAKADAKTSANDVRFMNVYNALKRYKETYGDMLVPQPFEVPDKSEDWPEETWGLRLGARVNAIRERLSNLIQKDGKCCMTWDSYGVHQNPNVEKEDASRKQKRNEKTWKQLHMQ